MGNPEGHVECGIHGKSSATYVCQHLIKGERLGFNYGYDPDDPDALYPDAWCDECEKVREAEGEWNEKSEAFSDTKLLCASCYEDMRARNWLEDSKAYHDLVCSSIDYLQDKQAGFTEAFRINDHDRWDWYQETGKLIFSNKGIPQVEAEIDFSGTLSTKSDTWMWAWANESHDEKIKSSSREVRDIGEQLGYLKLAGALWTATEEDGWEMTAIMAKTLNAIGVYRTPDDARYTYMVIKNAKWLK